MDSSYTLLFDLDGTLVNSLQDITNACNHAISQLGFAPKTTEQVKSMVGGGVRRLLARALETQDSKQIDLAREYFGPKYFECMLENTRLYPGLEEALNQLQDMGFQLFIATNKPQQFAGPIIQHLKLDRWFLAWACGDEVPIRKPDPAILHLAMSRADATFNAERSIYIGDMEIDNETAHNAGCSSVQVSWGFGQATQNKYQPDLTIHQTSELVDSITQLVRRGSLAQEN